MLNYGVGAVGGYLAFLGFLTLVSLILNKETRDTDLDTMREEAAVSAAIEATSP